MTPPLQERRGGYTASRLHGTTPAGHSLRAVDDFLNRDLSQLGPVLSANEAASFESRMELRQTDPAAWQVLLEKGVTEAAATSEITSFQTKQRAQGQSTMLLENRESAHRYFGLCKDTVKMKLRVYQLRDEYKRLGQYVHTLQHDMVKKCRQRQKQAQEQCRCTQTACEGVNEDTCGHDVKQKADKAKRDRESLWRQLQQARFTYRYKGSSSCKMFIRYAEWGHALLKSIEDAVEKFVKAAACLIVETLLAKVGEAIDWKLQAYFPPIKAMQSTPMCHDNFAKNKVAAAKNKVAAALGSLVPPSSQLRKRAKTILFRGRFHLKRKTLAHSRDDGLKEISSEIKDSFKNMLSGSMLANDPYVPFAWSIFRFVAKAVDNKDLNNLIENAVETTIEFIIKIIKNALCGKLGSALMLLLSELMFCNLFCLDVCATGDAFVIGKFDQAVATHTLNNLPSPPLARCSIVPQKYTHKGWRHNIFAQDVPVIAMQVCDDPTCDAEVYDGHVITKSDAAKVFENDLEAIAPGGHGGASHCDDEHGCLNADASTGLPAQCQKADTIDARFVGCYTTDLAKWASKYPHKLVRLTGCDDPKYPTEERWNNGWHGDVCRPSRMMEPGRAPLAAKGACTAILCCDWYSGHMPQNS